MIDVLSMALQCPIMVFLMQGSRRILVGALQH